MNKSELLELVDKLDPSSRKVTEALIFLRLVVANNPNKSAEEIAKRPDVTQALDTINNLVNDSRKVIENFVDLIPEAAGVSLVNSLEQTFEKLQDDTKLNESNLQSWRTSEEPPSSWVAKIVLRIKWLVEWLRSQIENLTDAKFKIWTSQLAPDTCKYCRALHGKVLEVTESFAEDAAAVGFKRPYAGLFSPPLHPRCKCKLKFSDTIKTLKE